MSREEVARDFEVAVTSSDRFALKRTLLAHFDATEAALAEAEKRVADFETDRCENGHHSHDDCTEACSCVGAGKSRIEQAEDRAEDAVASLREAEERAKRAEEELKIEREHNPHRHLNRRKVEP